MKKQKIAGILFIIFPLLIQIPFALLIQHFNYPDILREPSGLILQRFAEAGHFIIWVWYSYAFVIFIFLFALLSYKSVSQNFHLERAIKTLGVISALAQLIALLRWTFLVPFLSELHQSANSPLATKTIEIIFQIQHNFIGVGIGEHIGQLTLIFWTLLMLKDILSFGRAQLLLGALSSLLFLVGLSEHLGVVFGFNTELLSLGAMLGFITWSVWVIWLGVRLVRGY